MKEKGFIVLSNNGERLPEPSSKPDEEVIIEGPPPEEVKLNRAERRKRQFKQARLGGRRY